MVKCPSNWFPGCSCNILHLEPNEKCWQHGWPDKNQCPYCGQFRGQKPCKRCGCDYGIPKPSWIDLIGNLLNLKKREK